MLILLASIFILGVVVFVFQWLFHRNDTDDTIVIGEADCATCSGENASCEQVCMMEAATKPVEYFDDEELDAYKGRPSSDYTDEEVEAFAEVLYTLRPEDLRTWGRSLTLREINLPDQLKDAYASLL